MAAESFVRRVLRFTVQLADNSGVGQPSTFPAGGNTAILPELRSSIRVQNSGALAGMQAQATIWGLSLDLMNQLSTLGMRANFLPKNQLTVEAGDAVSGLSLCYSGTILNAYADFSGAPDVPFIFECQAGLFNSVLNVEPSSFPQATKVADIMQSIATKMGVGFENNSNIQTVLPPMYFPGSHTTQWQAARAAAGINAALVVGGSVSATNNTGLILAIWPINGTRQVAIPAIGPGKGLISYPTYTPQGICFKTIYNPQLGFGGEVDVQGSELPKANGRWFVYKLDHILDSQVPKGLWESMVYTWNTRDIFPVLKR